MCTGGNLASVVCWVCLLQTNQDPEGPEGLSPMAYWILKANPSWTFFFFLVPQHAHVLGGSFTLIVSHPAHPAVQQ